MSLVRMVLSLTLMVAIIFFPQASQAFTAPFLASSSLRILKLCSIGALHGTSTSSSSIMVVETTTKTDVSIPYDAAARLSFDEWRAKYGKGDFNAERFEVFKANYEAATVANVIAAREARERSIANGQGAAVISTNGVDLNEDADMTLQSTISSSTTTMPAETATKTDVSIPYDAAARLSFDEWRTKYGKGDFNSERFEVFKANYEAATVANVIAAREARERSIANGQGAAVISTNGVDLNEDADMTLQSTISSSTTTMPAETATKTDVSIPYDAAARLSFDEWRTKYGKGDFNSERFEVFKANYEAATVANVIAAREARERSIANGQGAAVISTNGVDLNEDADMTLQSTISSSTTTMPAETATKTDVSIPYDAAARLSFDEWRTKYGKGDFNSERFEVFKANYEAVTVANVIAARVARERSIANGQGAAVISTNGVDLNEDADMTLQSTISSSTTTTMAETATKTDVSIPYDAAARLSFDEWRAKYGKGDFNSERFEVFKANYEAATVANVIAAREARERSIANGQGAAVISTSSVELNEYADTTLQEYEPLHPKTSDASIIDTSIQEAVENIMPRFSQDPKSTYEQKVIARRESIDEARRQPKSDEEDAVIAARYSGMTSEERAFNILLDLGLADLSPDPEDPDYYAGIDDDAYS